MPSPDCLRTSYSSAVVDDHACCGAGTAGRDRRDDARSGDDVRSLPGCRCARLYPQVRARSLGLHHLPKLIQLMLMICSGGNHGLLVGAYVCSCQCSLILSGYAPSGSPPAWYLSISCPPEHVAAYLLDIIVGAAASARRSSPWCRGATPSTSGGGPAAAPGPRTKRGLRCADCLCCSTCCMAATHS